MARVTSEARPVMAVPFMDFQIPQDSLTNSGMSYAIVKMIC
uniref:Uncharacterized protein n=1 Tax=Musa acuminata subsp. malaccensis TaxID=214687 RepID=A0A804K4A7_MUSAM